jgi:hypothetical protein
MAMIGNLPHESITVSTVAIGVSQYPGSATPRLKSMGFLATVEGGPIRYTTDGTTPTATVGHLVRDGGVITVTNPGEVKSFRAIRDTTATASATLKVTHGTDHVPAL